MLRSATMMRPVTMRSALEAARFAARFAARSFSYSSELAADRPAKTALHALHVERGGKMVDFGGWDMPVVYSDATIVESTLHTRAAASLFDVSHMGQIRVHGADRAAFMESIVVGDIQGLDENFGRLSVMTNETGGVIDDLVVSRREGHIYTVVNAGCFDKDWAHMSASADAFRGGGGDVTLELMEEHSLVALQGPKAAAVLESLSGQDLSPLPFMYGRELTLDGGVCQITRCGYTGEDGFEISVPSSAAVGLTETLLAHADVLAAGLGARDALRLEAGLCLYGHELEQDIGPVEAGLAWLIPRDRRVGTDRPFPGHEHVMQTIGPKANGAGKLPPRKRVGFLKPKGAPAREEAAVFDAEGNNVGNVTSGAYSPCLKSAIGMALVERKAAKKGVTQLFAENRRGKMEPLELAPMPFLECSYYKPE